MRKKGEHSSRVHEELRAEAATRGSVTFRGEERAQQGRGLDPLVDPKEHGVIRFANNLLVPDGNQFILATGVAMPVKSEPDTTGSMGRNVEIAFSVIPKVQHLLVQGSRAVLGRYHVQIATGVIQDRLDRFAYQISQFEPDNEVDRQMGLLVPEKGGGDSTEDYQLGLFATAFLTKTSISRYGLKGYYFPIGDEIGRNTLPFIYPKGIGREYPHLREWEGRDLLQRVFGESVLEKAFGTTNPQSLPSTRELGTMVQERWHTYFLQVGDSAHTTRWWSEILGRERVVKLPRTEYVAEVQACIIGLTEGVIDLQNAVEFLITEARMDQGAAHQVALAVANIHMKAQAKFPNFTKIPMAGARFASREDIWPVDEAQTTKPSAKPEPPAGDKIDWNL